MEEAYIVDGIRTAIGNFGGTLAAVRTDDLAAHSIAKLMDRNKDFDFKAIDDVVLGCANQAGEDNRNVARMALLLAGLPWSVPGETINRLCSSGMSAAVRAMQAIRANEGNVFIAGGVENMTRGPWVISKASTPFGRDAEMFDTSFGWRFINPALKELYGTHAMGETAENLVEKFNISREDQDRFAYNSQMKAARAQEKGRFKDEIAALAIPRRKQEPLIFDQDEFIRPETSIEVLQKLRPAFKKDGSVTAGNSSGLNDGSAALLITSGQALKDHNLKPMARIVSSGIAGVEPRIMGIGPVNASEIALKRAGLTMADMDVIELNEAFAAQSLAVIRQWGLADDDERINPNGGAIALGHPLGVSGARILQTAAIELQKTNKRYALCTMCVGVGQGYATIIERS